MAFKQKSMLLKIVWNFRISVNTSYPRVLARSMSFTSGENVRNLASKDGELRVFIVAGEVSGDIIASRFMKSLKKLSPFPVRFMGVGGSMMLQQGLNSLFPMEDISVMGIWELLPHLSRFRNKLNETVESALTFRPHVVLTVDSKGFSFRFLKQLRVRYGHYRVGNPQHFHYVAPSFWAWKGGEARLKRLVDFVDHVFCILPFEEEICRSNGLTATFVGHPTLEDAADIKINKHLEEWKIQGDAEEFRKNHGLTSGSTIISVLPGSRLQEVTRMLSIFSRTMEPLKDAFSELVAVIHVAPNKHVEEYLSSAVSEWTVPVILVPGGSPCMKYNSFSASRIALCASGTVAVELQLARLPCVVAYRVHPLTELFIRYKAKIPYISLPNILLGAPIIPEVLFGACTPSKLTPLASRIALCASGTVAVELQLARLPCVVAYRAHPLTELFIRYKAKIPYISLPNILLGAPIIPEVLFGACTPSKLAPLVMELMTDESLRWKQISAAEKFLKLLHPLKGGDGNSTERESILEEHTPSMIAASAVLNS